MRLSWTAFFLLTLSTLNCSAEYRAFLLEIKISPDNKRTVTSQLDDLQYPTYYPLQPGETITMLDTWMCWERSDYYQAICPPPSPTSRAPDNSDQSLENPTTTPAN